MARRLILLIMIITIKVTVRVIVIVIVKITIIVTNYHLITMFTLISIFIQDQKGP